MTIPLRKPASLPSMRFHPLLLTAACLLLPAHAAEPPLRDLLRDGLYTEEVTRDPEAAAKQYEQLLTRYAEQRDFAAAALFRLAEVRRKQDRKEDAITLYLRLLTEFPAAANETKLARENLAAIGGKMPTTAETAIDEESKELARLESLAKNAPDIILDPTTLGQAARKGWPKVVAYLLAAGSRPYVSDALRQAAEDGYLEIVKQLTAGDVPVPADVATEAIQAAIKSNRYTVLDFLLQRGSKPGEMFIVGDSSRGPRLLAYALLNGSPQCAEILLKHGADLDATTQQAGDSKSGGTALQRVIVEGKFDAANWLLDKGAKPDIPSRSFGITPLHEATCRQTSRPKSEWGKHGVPQAAGGRRCQAGNRSDERLHGKHSRRRPGFAHREIRHSEFRQRRGSPVSDQRSISNQFHEYRNASWRHAAAGPREMAARQPSDYQLAKK